MRKKRLTQKVIVAFILLTLLGGIVPAAAQDSVVTITITEERITWIPRVENGGMVLTIAGPSFHRQKEYRADAHPTFTPYRGGSPLPDGLYTYELQLLPVRDRDAPPRLDQEERGLSPVGSDEAIVFSGSFSILEGSFVTQDVPEDEEEEAIGPLSTQDVLHYDDVIITGSLCVGFDCQNGESFGFDTQILKENNLRIYFNDTSSAASFPTNDWRITVNDSTNGGASYFSIDDADDGTSIFKLEAGAPSNSLYVDDYGRVGMGTSTPYVEAHIKDSDTPTVRLEQDGSGGWTPQTWDVAGNESNFFVRDVTNGSQLPFRIQPGADSNALTIKSDGDVGIGTWSPSGRLDVVNEAETEHLLVVQDGGNVGIGTASPGDNLTILPSAAGGITVRETDDGNEAAKLVGAWGQGKLQLYHSGSETVHLAAWSGEDSYFNAGSFGIGTTSPSYLLEVDGSAGKPGGGTWSNSSDARLKENVQPIDGREALDTLSRLRGVTFEWINPEEHSAGTRAGLIAQEVEAVFPDWIEEREAQGNDVDLIPEEEKAKAVHFPHDFNAYVIEAVKALDAENQALSEIVEEQDAAIDALQQQNADLEARLTALEKTAGSTGNRTSGLPLGGMLIGGLLVVGVVASRRRKR